MIKKRDKGGIGKEHGKDRKKSQRDYDCKWFQSLPSLREATRDLPAVGRSSGEEGWHGRMERERSSR